MCVNLALKMTIKHYYQADFLNTSWRLECVLERKCLTSTQFMNFTTKKKKITIGIHNGVTFWMPYEKPGVSKI